MFGGARPPPRYARQVRSLLAAFVRWFRTKPDRRDLIRCFGIDCRPTIVCGAIVLARVTSEPSSTFRTSRRRGCAARACGSLLRSCRGVASQVTVFFHDYECASSSTRTHVDARARSTPRSKRKIFRGFRWRFSARSRSFASASRSRSAFDHGRGTRKIFPHRERCLIRCSTQSAPTRQRLRARGRTACACRPSNAAWPPSALLRSLRRGAPSQRTARS